MQYICCCTCSQAKEERANEARHGHPSSTPEGVRCASELQDEAAGEVEEDVYP